MVCVTRESFLRPAEIQYHKVALPECGPECYVNIRPLGASDLLQLQATLPNTEFAYDLLARVMASDAGQPLFTSADDCRTNFNLSVATLKHLVDEVVRISGIEVEEEKN